MSNMPSNDQFRFGILGVGLGVVLTCIALAIVMLPREPDFSLSGLVVRPYYNPEHPQLLLVFGCLPMHNGRSGGQNAPLAAQHRLEARIANGVFVDRSSPNYRQPSLTETLSSLPQRSALRTRVRSEIRDEFGCDFAYSNLPE